MRICILIICLLSGISVHADNGTIMANPNGKVVAPNNFWTNQITDPAFSNAVQSVQIIGGSGITNNQFLPGSPNSTNGTFSGTFLLVIPNGGYWTNLVDAGGNWDIYSPSFGTTPVISSALNGVTTFAAQANGTTFNATGNGFIGQGSVVPDLSPGNFIWDIQNVTAKGGGQLATTYGSSAPNTGLAIWAANSAGTGSNIWGRPISFPGGFQVIGNYTWTNIYQTPYSFQAETHYMGYGPSNSSQSASWPNGFGGASVQPGWNFVNANPWAAGAWLGIRSGMTNAIHGQFVGQDKDGNNIYVPQFGFEIFQISDAYYPTNKGIGDKAEANQSPSDLLLGTDPTVDFYFCQNGGHIGGDSVGTQQVPSLVIDTSTFGLAGHPLFRVPYQIQNVWMPRNPSWQDSLLVDEVSGMVYIPRTNNMGSLNVTNDSSFNHNLYVAGMLTNNGSIGSAGTISSATFFNTFGPSSGYQFLDRFNGSSWSWYANNNVASLYSSGNLFSVSNSGDISWTGNANGNGAGISNVVVNASSIVGQLSWNNMPSITMSNNFDVLNAPANGGFSVGGNRGISANLFFPTNSTQTHGYILEIGGGIITNAPTY